jgi:hypothetical protein
MNTTQKRIALLTGASLATLGVASPALAATHTGIQHATLAATGNVTDTITLCAAFTDWRTALSRVAWAFAAAPVAVAWASIDALP